jgi:hypothetical protein
MALRRANGGGEVVAPRRLRRPARRARLRHDRVSQSRSNNRYTAHAVVSPTTTREVLYVSATRGRESNSLYVDTSFDSDPATGHDGTDVTTDRSRRARRSVGERRLGPVRAREPREGTTEGGGLRGPRRRVRDLGPSRLNSIAWASCWLAQDSNLNASRRSARAPPTAPSSQLSETPRRAVSTWKRPCPDSWQPGRSRAPRTLRP